MMPAAGPASWLSHWARRTPHRTALLTPSGERLTFQQLDRRVDAVAAALARRGVRRGVLVCVQSPDPLEVRLLRWAANRCDTAEALLDPQSPQAEVNRRLEVLGEDVLLLDPDGVSEVCASAARAFRSSPDPRAPARVLFTTGSTGRPRAVLQLARHLRSAARSNALARGLRPDDVVLAALPPHHAAGSLFEDTALFVGGALALMRQGAGGTSKRLLDALLLHRPDVVSLVPSLLSELVGDAEGAAALRVLRLLNYAGEAAHPDLVDRLVREFPGELYRGYGLSEAGPLVAVLGDGDHRGAAAPPQAALGRPAPGVAVRLAPLGDGSSELQVRSGHVMDRYLNDPEATEAALQDGWLRTGDLVSLSGGVLMHCGRLGNRIRSGAEWIDLDEVRRAREGAPAVVSAAVVAVPSARWGQRPVAFVTGTGDLSLSRVHRHLAAELARFKRPDLIRVVTGLPRTAAGKVDHDLLRGMAGSASE
ncbi:class I adenylate-forming enzyme family protein [Kitasatospora phosalacinea]|uniref:class I adenylate-forming enzyme family protein n=1 Tax=Kitasatospora phosalacinea TaxID=2065 RepID=UPI0036653696